MKKSPTSNPKGGDIEWEMRPGGMLVQNRHAGAAGDCGPAININVSHGPTQFEVFVPSQSTFGDLKKILLHRTGLRPNEQKLLFRGKERDDEEQLVTAGVKDNSKVVLLEDPESKENKLEEIKKSSEMSKASEAVAVVSNEVDKLAERVAALEAAIGGGTKVSEKEFDFSTELLMRELLKLDSIEAEGEAKIHRKAEVRRIQKFVDLLDTLKARNLNPFNAGNSVSVTTQWETFDSGMGSLNAPPPVPSSAQVSQDWERFD